jgi:hypothetical protein
MADGWEGILAGWLRGTPTGHLVGQAGGEEIGLIQDAFVYRLVWAVETVRVHAIARDDARTVLLTGMLPLALTYGLPSLQGNLLAQAGLASRAMVVRLLEAFPADFATTDGIAPWLAEVAEQLPADFWPDSVSRDLWRSFTVTSRVMTTGRWQETETRHEVRWDDTARGPVAGAPVQVVFSHVRGEASVYSLDFSPLGVVANLQSDALDGHVTAYVDADPGWIVVRRFAPVQFALRAERN